MVTDADSSEELHSIYGYQHGLGDDEEYFYEVSINISPASRGKGFGKQLLTNGIRRLHKEVKNCKFIRAEVKKENEYSNKLFKSCGFIFIEDESGMNTYELSI